MRQVSLHRKSGRQSSLGPDLTEIGIERTPQALRLSLTSPAAEISKEYLTVVVTTRQNQRIEGIALNEDDLSIQIRDTEGNPRSFLKENLKDLHREERSLMPSYASRLSGSEIDDLVAYLESLRGMTDPHSPVARELEPNSFSDSVAWMNRANRDSQELPDMLLDELQIPVGAPISGLGRAILPGGWRSAWVLKAR